MPTPPTVTPELVVELWDALARHYGSQTVPKSRSPLMRAAGGGLQLIGILDRSLFMSRFTTVIGRRIYVPFVPGGPDRMPLISQMDTCIHEHQHIAQLIRDGRPKFWSTYLASSRARALYEAEAYTCGLELHWWYEGLCGDPARIARTLEHYGCTEADIQAATDVLEANAERVRAGETVTEAMAVARSWLEARGGA